MAGQGAGNNRGQGAGNGRFVKFTHGAAQRIAKAVRVVEGGDRNQPGITFDHPSPASSVKVFRICTFTGAWSIGSAKTVTFKNQTATPNTVSATNLFFPVTNTATADARDCAIAKDGTAWYLIDVRLATATAVFASGVTQRQFVSSVSTQALNLVTAVATSTASVVTDVSISASLNTSNCTIAVSRTLTTASHTFVSGVTSTTQSVVVSSVTTTGIFVQSTFTGTYLTLEI